MRRKPLMPGQKCESQRMRLYHNAENVVRFTKDTADKTGKTERGIQQDCRARTEDLC
jgi:hypothetical protein